MTFDAHKNFAISTVATAPSPATSGTSLVVAAGEGTMFPVAPFNATVWPAGAQSTAANAEIIRVTVISTDTLTITRAQESSSARTVVVGDQIAATITAKTLTDVETSEAKLYDYEVTGSDKASIDTFVDGTAASLSVAYNVLEIWFYARTDETVILSVVDLTFNNDTGSNYDNQRVRGRDTTASAGRSAAQAKVQFLAPGASALASVFGSAKITIPNYAGTVGFKVGDLVNSVPDNTTSANIDVWGFGYRSTSAISRVKVIPDTAAKNFKVGTRLLIYGR